MNNLSKRRKAFRHVLEEHRLQLDYINYKDNGNCMEIAVKTYENSTHQKIEKAFESIFDYIDDLQLVIAAEEPAAANFTREKIEELQSSTSEAECKIQNEMLAEKMASIQASIIEQQKTTKSRGFSHHAGGTLYGKIVLSETKSLGDIIYKEGITAQESKVRVAGVARNIDMRPMPSGKSVLIRFSIQDRSGAVSCKAFIPKKNFEKLEDALIEGAFFDAEGTFEYDTYDKEILLSLSGLRCAEEKTRRDEAELKRVELHLHSQYSAMDGIAKVKDIIAQAKAFGHDSIGITDHGVLQAYPEMMALGKANDIKVLYGVEAYMIDDCQNIVTGHQDADFDDEFIFFDLETTGLIAGRDKIIEIAAVKMRNRQIVDTLSHLVKIKGNIPPRITRLTGITNTMLEKDGIDEALALKNFVDFVGDAILVAHNAEFDMSFLRIALAKNRILADYTYVDTLQLSRAVLTNISRHNLKRLASYFKVDMGNHHRALDDSVCSTKILINLLNLSEKRGAMRISQLNTLMNMEQYIKYARPYHIILYAQNAKGLKALYKLVSQAHTEYFYRNPRMFRSMIQAHRENLIVGSACESGEVFKAVLNHFSEERLKEIVAFYDYLEVQPLGNNAFLLEDMLDHQEELIEINKKIIALGDTYNKPVVATGDVHFVHPEDAFFREIIQTGQKYKDAHLQPPLYYRSTEEMLDEFHYIESEKAYEIVVTNTRKIADLIEPIDPIPQGVFPPIIKGSDKEIKEMVYAKAHELYGATLPKIVAERIEKELTSIIGNGYSVLYLIAQKLVARSVEDGYLVGSRGSVGSSLVAMLCGITEVNSLPPHYVCPQCHHFEAYDSTQVGVGPDMADKNCPNCQHLLIKDGFDIPFETFLGFEGDKEPDIDLNFSGEYQGQAHAYTETLFGKDNVFRAGTISTVADNTAFGYVKNYFEDKGIDVPKAEEERLKVGCTGVKRTTGQHPGGIIVVPKTKDIHDFTPIQYPADDKNSQTYTTHFDYHSIEGRLLKLDILGHDDPTMLRMLEDLTGVDPQSIALDDTKVLSLFTGTEALNFVDEGFEIPLGICGIPEFGTGFVREMVMDTKPNTFADLIRISGLSHGTDVWTNNAQNLVREKVATIREVICTRDDIMIGLIAMGLEPIKAFTIMEKVRKGRGLTAEEEKAMRENAVPRWYIDSCKKIKYMFPKAHAAAYVTMAFRIAYYKVYHPLAYYATYFSVRAKEFDIEKMTHGIDHIRASMQAIEEIPKKMRSPKENSLYQSLEIALEMACRGYDFWNVDVYKSHNNDFQIIDNGLRPPLNTVDGLGDTVAKAICEERRIKPFISKEDLQKRAKVNRSSMEKLEKLGALKSLPASNQVSFLELGSLC